MLDEVADKYEIVDGKQRITTCFLLLIRLYNYFVSCPREQEALKKYIKPYGSYLLENDSVGDYLSENGNEISININVDSDVYKQKEDFIRAYKKLKKYYQIA